MVPPVLDSKALLEQQLARVGKTLERVTDELIRALFTQARDPQDERATRIRILEQQRDELHERLSRLEEFVAQAKTGTLEAPLGDARSAA